MLSMHSQLNMHTPPSPLKPWSQPGMPHMPNLDAKCPTNAGEATSPTPAHSGKVSIMQLRRETGPMPPTEDKLPSRHQQSRQYVQYIIPRMHSQPKMDSWPSFDVKYSVTARETIEPIDKSSMRSISQYKLSDQNHQSSQHGKRSILHSLNADAPAN